MYSIQEEYYRPEDTIVYLIAFRIFPFANACFIQYKSPYNPNKQNQNPKHTLTI